MSILVAFLIFSFIVFIHELGHFIFARRGGIAVEEFAIGMGPKLFGFRRNGTDWSIRLLPIGGFCKMHGEDGEEKPASETKETTETIEISETSGRPIKDENVLVGDPFYAKPVGIRISAVMGGPLFNFILALVFSFIYVALGSSSTTVVGNVPDDLPAYAAGISVGDKMISIDGHRLLTPMEARIYINVAGGDPVDVVIERKSEDGSKERITYTITPDFAEIDETIPPEESDNFYFIGVGYEQAPKGLFSVIKYGTIECLSWVKIVFYSLGMLVTGQISLSSLSGPVGIVNEISSGYKASLVDGITAVIRNISFFIVLLSANLGVMNLLPLPALDGGRLVFLFAEALRGKPIAPEKEGFIHFVGFVALMLLMVFVLFNDLTRLFG